MKAVLLAFACFLLAIAAASATLAADAKARPIKLSLPAKATATTGGGGAADLLNNTKFDPKKGTPQGAVKITLGCADKNGKAYRNGDAGYEQCLTDPKARPVHGGKEAIPEAVFELGR